MEITLLSIKVLLWWKFIFCTPDKLEFSHLCCLSVQDAFKRGSWFQALSPNNWPWQELYIQSQGEEWIVCVRLNYKVEDPATKKTELIKAWCWQEGWHIRVIFRRCTPRIPSQMLQRSILLTTLSPLVVHLAGILNIVPLNKEQWCSQALGQTFKNKKKTIQGFLGQKVPKLMNGVMDATVSRLLELITNRSYKYEL